MINSITIISHVWWIWNLLSGNTATSCSRVFPRLFRAPRANRIRVVFFHARRAILLIHVATPPERTSVGRDSSIHLIRLQKTRATCFRNCGNENDEHARARYNAQRYEAFRVAVHLFNLFNYHPAAYLSAFEIEASKNCMCAFTGRYFFMRRDEVEICWSRRGAVNALLARAKILRRQNFS